MMDFICSILSILYFSHVQICSAIPIKEDKGVLESEETVWSSGVVGTLIGVSSAFCLILVIGICVCCGKEYFKWPRSHGRRINRNSGRNGAGLGGNEISIFPPPGADQYLSSSTSDIYFEPLPDITSQLNDRNRLPRLSASVSSIVNEEWFAEPYKNFPRNQLQYLRKLGSGWFGQVLEGRAIGVDTDHTSTVITKGLTSQSTPVVVKALREDASSQEQTFFLQELTPYRDLNHKNVLRIVAYCLETQPLLVLLQHCPKGDLKSVLRKDASLTEHQLLTMAENVSAGLSHMHQFDFIHTDLAARNCLVQEDLNVKIGDYGFSLETYQNEYYLAENVALPIRWCAPETLNCTETTIETIELTKNANVWSFGVVLWEILTRGQLPYEELDEDGVIQKVVLERSRSLALPQHTSGLYASKLDEILRSCFSRCENRPAIAPLHFILNNLCSGVMDDSSDNDLDDRWNRLADGSSMVQQHNILVGNNSMDMRFETDFNPRNHLAENGSPTASLKNLHGSAEDLDARIAAKFGSAFPSWLGLEPGQAMDSFTEEISDAIQRLDEALSEDVSESTTCVSSPEKTSLNFKLGRDSLVLNPPGAQRTLSDGEEENLTMRLEQGDFSELVRLKSQSVQDFMRLTVVDDGSDSSDKTSQPGSLIGGEFASSTQVRPQEKNFSSESNLKEAVRDAGFMVELEKLQAEHNKFSIISEVSREGMSSLDYCPTDNLAEERLQSINEDETGTQSFLVEEAPSSMVKGGMEAGESSETMLNDGEGRSTSSSSPFEGVREKDASPDCIISSRDAIPAPPLPDVISHDGYLKRSTSSSSSSFDETGNKSETENHDRSQGLNDFSPVDHSPRFVSDSSYTSRSNDLYEGICDEKMIEDKTNLNFSSDNVVMGEDVIIGALDDFSLDFYKPVKSTYIDPKEPVDNSFILDSYPIGINNADYDHNDNNMGLICVNSVSPQFEESSNTCVSDQTLNNACDKTINEECFFDPSKMNGLNQPSKYPLNFNEKEEVGKLSHGETVNDPTPQLQSPEGEPPLSDDLGYSSNLISKGESCIDIPLSNLNDLIKDVNNQTLTNNMECASNEGELLLYEESQNISYSKDDLPHDSQSTNLDHALPVEIMTETSVENQMGVVSPLAISSSQTTFEKFSSEAGCDSDMKFVCAMLFPETESYQSSSPKENNETTKSENESGGNDAESNSNEPDNTDKLTICELYPVENAITDESSKPIVDDDKPMTDDDKPVVDEVKLIKPMVDDDPITDERMLIDVKVEHIGNKDVVPMIDESKPITDDASIGITDEVKLMADEDRLVADGNSKAMVYESTSDEVVSIANELLPIADEIKSVSDDNSKPMTDEGKLIMDKVELINDEGIPIAVEVKPLAYEVDKLLADEFKPLADEAIKPVTDEDIEPMITNKDIKSVTDKINAPITDIVTQITEKVDKPMVDEAKPITYEVKPIADEVVKPSTSDLRSLTDEAIPIAGEHNDSVNVHIEETPNQLEGKPGVKVVENECIVPSLENKDKVMNLTRFNDTSAGPEAEMEFINLEGNSSEADNDSKASSEDNESCVSPLRTTDVHFEGETLPMNNDISGKVNLFSDISYLSKERSDSNVDAENSEENNRLFEVDGLKSEIWMEEFLPTNWSDQDETPKHESEDRAELETLNKNSSQLGIESEEGGEFWERQMAAWQEAAEQTKELLYEAYQNEEGVLESEDDFLDSTKSPVSSQKSPFSSSDRLDNESDDEGTYVSYDTTDDDEMVRFNAEDIDALRSELCLKLGDLNDSRTPAPDNSEEDANDLMFINYKSNCPSTLSPIKEEVLTDLDISQSSEMEESSSLEFTEINRDGETGNGGDSPFCLIPSLGNMSSTNVELQETLPSLELTSEEAKDSLILEDLDCDGTPTPATVIGPIIPKAATEDMLLVDTLTNNVTLIDSGRPQSHIAFMLEKKEEEPFSLPSKDDLPFEDDDVAFESLPYEDTSGHFSSSFPPRSAPSFTDDDPPIDAKKIEDSSQHNYQSYFTSGLSSITYPSPSLERNDAFESADHISLPYDVNLPFKEKDNDEEWAEPTKAVLHAEDSPHQVEQTVSVDSGKEALILDESPPSETSPFVTLSFLGRLYNAEESNSHKSEEAQLPSSALRATQDNSLDQSSSTDQYFSIKSDSESSEDEIEEELPPDTTPSKQGTKTPTPVRTPSHLSDFVWRPDPDHCYTPDWESDSECNEDVESSSTSGEFIWQAGGESSLNPVSCLPAIDKTSLEWQMANEKKEEEPPSPSSSQGDDSESGEEEFTPSTWNKELIPNRSLLKSPETSSNGKKSVRWKRQRHHRVYEYPPEPQSWHADVSHSSPRKTWPGPSLDYFTLADFELGGDEFLGDDSDDFEEFYHEGKSSMNPQIFNLAPLAYDKSGDLYSDGCEFYMGSPGTAFAFSRSSFTPAEFFPSKEDTLTLDDFAHKDEASGDHEDLPHDVLTTKHTLPEEFFPREIEFTSDEFTRKDEGTDEVSGDHERELSPPQNVSTKHTPTEDAKLAREKLRLDLPTICLQENDP